MIQQDSKCKIWFITFLLFYCTGGECISSSLATALHCVLYTHADYGLLLLLLGEVPHYDF